MQGGGSLVIALPALLGFRRTYPNTRLSLVTTHSVLPFAEAIAIFDEIIVLDDRSLPRMMASGTRLLRKLFRIDTIIDFEVYSRLTTVFSVLTCARNRIGFYLETTFWRENLATHLIFFNRFAGSYRFYESTMAALNADSVALPECGLHVALRNGLKAYDTPIEGRVTVADAPERVCLAPVCSELGKERMLSGAQWARVLPRLIGEAREIVVLGAPADSPAVEDLIRYCRPALPEVSWVNACDGRALRDSLGLLAGCARLIAIDSSILHFGRLFGIPTVSFWGPTDPMTRLQESSSSMDEIWYEKVVCSPCVHVAEIPPCSGRNVCIEAAVRRCCGEEVGSIKEISRLSPVTRLDRGSGGTSC
jgi:ADP-heptose:LPS heptosyltransferase